MAIAPSIHVQVLLVQVALLLVTVIGHVILPRPRVRAREAALHLDELPVIQEVLRPSEVHLNPEVRHQLALLPRDGLMVLRHLGRAHFASEEGGPNEDTRLTRGGVLTPSEVQLHSTQRASLVCGLLGGGSGLSSFGAPSSEAKRARPC